LRHLGGGERDVFNRPDLGGVSYIEQLEGIGKTAKDRRKTNRKRSPAGRSIRHRARM